MYVQKIDIPYEFDSNRVDTLFALKGCRIRKSLVITRVIFGKRLLLIMLDNYHGKVEVSGLWF